MVISVFVVYLDDRMADWELWLTAIAQHQERGLYHTSLVQEKIKIQNLQYDFYWMCIAFAPL